MTTGLGADPDALRVCSVEAFALLLTALGESRATTTALVDAVIVNNRALHAELEVRPKGGLPTSTTSGAARRRRRRQRERDREEEEREAVVAKD